MLTLPKEHSLVTAPPNGHILGHILLDNFKLQCIYNALLNNVIGHYHGHF
jgi:hypothetical protein